MKSKCASPKQSAFTLVELLVVIGIIALLISILLPALNKARAQANIAKCAANMRSATQALMIYVNENKGWLPGPTTSGAVWKSSGNQITLTATSSDETPLQNMDWVSPTFGKTFRWPENDYERLKQIYNAQLRCPSNDIPFSGVYPTGMPFNPGDLMTASYSAVLQFNVNPLKDGTGGFPAIINEMYTKVGLTLPPGYAPMITKVGPAAGKVFLVEGTRYIAPGTGQDTINMTAGPVTYNVLRYQIIGGNFMIGAPITNFKETPYQLIDNNQVNYTSKRISPIAKNYGWRHDGKMNLAFFDGHVELRAVADSIQTSLYVPRGTVIGDDSATYDPKDKTGQIVN